jgi:hypothetical protein
VTKPSASTKPEFIVLYGRPGGGKTYLAATASELPGVRKTLILDTEGSTVGTLSDFDDDKVDIIRVSSFVMLEAILDKLLDPNAVHEYDVVILDTLDVAQQWAVQHFKDAAPYTKSGEKDGFWAWGEVSKWTVDRLGKALRAAPFLAVVVLHEKEEKNGDGGIVKNLNLQGSAKDTWPGIPDVVAYLERKVMDGEPRTIAFFETDDNKVTKNRFKFPAKVLEPTIPALFNLIDKRKEDK